MKPENKSLMFLYLYVFVMFILGILLGWCSNELYKGYSNHRIINGLYLTNQNWTGAMETAKSLDGFGNWVCVNTRGISYKDATKTINHEVVHHIFNEMLAEDCEKDFDKCANLLDNWRANGTK
jgi:hypothetical protein